MNSAISQKCSPEGIRTLVTNLRSWGPRPLDDGALVKSRMNFHPGAVSVELYCNCAGVPGLEPRLTEPESAGLPITPYPKKQRPLVRGKEYLKN